MKTPAIIPPQENAPFHYTPRELEIIKCILMGYTHKEIVNIFGFSAETLKSHIKNLMNKTNRHWETDLAVYFLTHGFTVNADQTIVTFNGRII